MNDGINNMNLNEAVQQLPKLNHVMTIYARHPWTPLSDAQIAIEGSEAEKTIKAAGLRYFLEVFIAQEFVEGWMKTQKNPTSVQACIRLIEYATHDA